jgi:hypothetical protein
MILCQKQQHFPTELNPQKDLQDWLYPSKSARNSNPLPHTWQWPSVWSLTVIMTLSLRTWQQPFTTILDCRAPALPQPWTLSLIFWRSPALSPPSQSDLQAQLILQLHRTWLQPPTQWTGLLDCYLLPLILTLCQKQQPLATSPLVKLDWLYWPPNQFVTFIHPYSLSLTSFTACSLSLTSFTSFQGKFKFFHFVTFTHFFHSDHFLSLCSRWQFCHQLLLYVCNLFATSWQALVKLDWLFWPQWDCTFVIFFHCVHFSSLSLSFTFVTFFHQWTTWIVQVGEGKSTCSQHDRASSKHHGLMW